MLQTAEQSLSQAPDELLLDGEGRNFASGHLPMYSHSSKGERVSCHSTQAFLPALSQAVTLSLNCSAVLSRQSNKKK